MFQIIAASIIIPYSTSTSSVDQTYEGFIECILLNCIGNFMHSVSIILGRHSREAIIIHWTKAQFYQIQYTLLNKNIPLLHPYYCRDQILYSSLVGGIIRSFIFWSCTPGILVMRYLLWMSLTNSCCHIRGFSFLEKFTDMFQG